MAIPVQFQQFKSAGIYRVVYDKSTVLGTEAELLRLVVGYSPKGPFNTPVYIKSVSDFKTMFGDISKSLEKRGCFFHRTCIHALEAGPILCLNLKSFTTETSTIVKFGENPNVNSINVKSLFDTSRFWKLEQSNLAKDDASNYLAIASIDSKETSGSIFIRKADADMVAAYNVSVSDWYKTYNEDVPEYLEGYENKLISDFFAEVLVFKGKFTPEQVSASPALAQYFNVVNGSSTTVRTPNYATATVVTLEDGTYTDGENTYTVEEVTEVDGTYYLTSTITYDESTVVTESSLSVKDTIKNAFDEDIDALTALYNDSASGALNRYVGCLLPNFIDPNSGYKALDIIFNVDSDIHHMMMNINDSLLEDSNDIDAVLSNFALKNGELNRTPIYLEGYTYLNAKPAGSDIASKFDWQQSILNVLTTEVGLREGLLSSAEIDYRYIVDSFETLWRNGVESKAQISAIAKSKELCFAILNYPSMHTLVKYGDHFLNSKGIIDIKKVANGVILPSEANGASFCAFYTPLKFSDGYVDYIIPSAGLVSNLFIGKYNGRAPYSIIAGPNYANIQYAQLVGPEYNFSQSELHIIEPIGVNCMVYRPTFGTFINANQTAKQTPKTALSSINVRELVIYLQDEIGKILQSYQWEFNNPTTRDAIKTKADLVCETAKRDGGIQAYLNVMDESNNTADIIDNEMCVISTSIEPGRGMGKMVHELTIYRTGGMSATIKEE